MSTLVVPANDNIYSAVECREENTGVNWTQTDASARESVTLLLVRDLLRAGWKFTSTRRQRFEFRAPQNYDKDTIRKSMGYSRNAILEQDRDWIESHLGEVQANMANGMDAWNSEIRPRICPCQSQRDHDIFRLLRLSWSSPYSEYVGRRMRLLIRDDAIPGSPVIGIAALGSSIVHIPSRDQWIGWDTATRTSRLVYMMDAYVVGAISPYNHLLGGKLVAYLLASNEIRDLFAAKYAGQRTLINGRTANDIVLIVTSSLFGTRSSQYNRIKYREQPLYIPIGSTAGYGSLHISPETFDAMRRLASSEGHELMHRFGDGPNWRMRVVRTACELLELDAETILKHSFRRGLYAVPMATNFREFLLASDNSPHYYDRPASDLASYWHDRWLLPRKQRADVKHAVQSFRPDTFTIEPTPLVG